MDGQIDMNIVCEFNRGEKIDESPIKKLERRVFVYDSSEYDKKYFLTEFYKWLKNDGYVDGVWKSFTQLLYLITWERNHKGKHIKYMFFNERTQRLCLDRDFYKWAKLAVERVFLEMEQKCIIKS